MEDETEKYKSSFEEGAESDYLEFDKLVEILDSSRLHESAVEHEFMSRFSPFFDTLESKYFSAHELAFLGPNNTGNHKCAGTNEYPVEALWRNLESLVPALNSIREELGHPIRLSSIYRGQQYNTCVDGVVDSQHRKYNAADCVVGATSPVMLHKAAKRVRDRGVFKGGLALYDTFVHVDVRGVNVDWTKTIT